MEKAWIKARLFADFSKCHCFTVTWLQQRGPAGSLMCKAHATEQRPLFAAQLWTGYSGTVTLVCPETSELLLSFLFNCLTFVCIILVRLHCGRWLYIITDNQLHAVSASIEMEFIVGLDTRARWCDVVQCLSPGEQIRLQ